MAEFLYTPKSSSLVDFLGTIQTVGIPDKVTVAYVKSLGFTSSNDRYIRSILKSLGFLDSSGVPTDRWKIYRDKKKAPAELAIAIQEAYSALYSVYPDAHRKDNEALRNFFTSNTTVGEKAVYYMVNTFKALCELADFALVPQPSQPIHMAEPLKITMPPGGEIEVTETTAPAQGITVNVNIQLTLPETKDSSIYDSIFESLKKHLLS